jgi:hypothetical protein
MPADIFFAGFGRIAFLYVFFCHVASYVQNWHPGRAVQSEQVRCEEAFLQSDQRSLTRRSGYVDGTSSPRHQRSIDSSAKARLVQGEGHILGVVGVS